jgi:NAD(P) transhydrogenase subunit alpha
MLGAILSAGGAVMTKNAIFSISFLNLDVSLSSLLGFLAVIFATINVVGGFMVTHRMLEMFRRKD